MNKKTEKHKPTREILGEPEQAVFYGGVVGQPEVGGPSTVTDIVPVMTFPLGWLVTKLAVMPATPQSEVGLTLPVAVTCAT